MRRLIKMFMNTLYMRACYHIMYGVCKYSRDPRERDGKVTVSSSSPISQSVPQWRPSSIKGDENIHCLSDSVNEQC